MTVNKPAAFALFSIVLFAIGIDMIAQLSHNKGRLRGYREGVEEGKMLGRMEGYIEAMKEIRDVQEKAVGRPGREGEPKDSAPIAPR